MFSSQRPKDAALILKLIEHFHQWKQTRIKFLEIGTFGGDTARGVWDRCWSHNIELEYWGIDNRSQIHSEAPFPGANFVVGDSAEVFHLIPFDFDAVLVDGCHCINHAILDTLHYGARVKSGGYMLFHDTSPEIQQTMKDPHGPNIPEFHNSVLAAHKLLGFPFSNWARWAEDYEPGATFGGMKIYVKD